MKLLIAGGTGFIGSHLVDRLLREGHEVRIFDRNPERFRKPIDSVEYCILDFGNRAALASALNNIEMVFHMISTTTPKTSNNNTEFDVTSNVVKTLSLLTLWLVFKLCKKLCRYSLSTNEANNSVLYCIFKFQKRCILYIQMF